MGDWKAVASVVSSLAPTVGATFGGPVGAGVGIAIKALAGAFGITDANPQPDAVKAAMEADPDALLKVRMAEIEFQRIQLEEETKRMGMEIQDLKDARARQIEHEKTIGGTDWNLYALAWLLVIGFFILTGLMYFYPLPKESVGPINQLFGALVAGFSGVIGYFFGSSQGSAVKSKLLAEMELKKK